MPAQPPQYESALCPDWVFSNNSDVHVAKDRGWFTDYIPFSSRVGEMYFGSTQQVVGIGTVKIKTKRSPDHNNHEPPATLTLNHVLHVPSYVCNVIGLPQHFLEEYNVITQHTHASWGSIKSRHGHQIAFFEPGPQLYCPKVSEAPSGYHLGPHIWEENTYYMINAQWPDSEQGRYAALLAQRTVPSETAAPLSQDEHAWLRRNFGNEYRLLREFGLRINSEGDREEGRQIVRTLMIMENNSDDDEKEEYN